MEPEHRDDGTWTSGIPYRRAAGMLREAQAGDGEHLFRLPERLGFISIQFEDTPNANDIMLAIDGVPMAPDEARELIESMYAHLQNADWTYIRRRLEARRARERELASKRWEKAKQDAAAKAAQKKRIPQPGMVYIFSLGDDLYKVGRTTQKRIEYRRCQIEDEYGIPIAVHKTYAVTDACKAEKAAHQALAHRRHDKKGRKELFFLDEKHISVLDEVMIPFMEESDVE